MNLDEATELLGLAGEFSYTDLKRRFRELSLTMHPDVGGDQAQFIRLMDAFKVLEGHASADENGSQALSTVDGTPLSELGKGYPLTVSAKSCGSCEGRGWQSFSNHTVEVKCPECDGDGKFWVDCKKCSGSGRYMHPRTGKDIGECYACAGTGRFYPPYKQQRRPYPYSFFWGNDAKYINLRNGTRIRVNRCRECSGEGTVRVKDDSQKLYRKCDACRGIGEVKMWNPVIPRGLFANGLGR